MVGYLNSSVTLGFKTPVIVQEGGLYLEYPQMFSRSYGTRRSETHGKIKVREVDRRV